MIVYFKIRVSRIHLKILQVKDFQQMLLHFFLRRKYCMELKYDGIALNEESELYYLMGLKKEEKMKIS